MWSAGSKEPLLQQLVPATYLALEECVTALAAELRDPVLRHEDYKRLVSTPWPTRNPLSQEYWTFTSFHSRDSRFKLDLIQKTKKTSVFPSVFC